MNVLIIDDEPLVLQTVYREMMDIGIPFSCVDTAQSAAKAREMIRETHYDIFLCDIQMPEENGISFAKWVLKEDADAVFIFLTAHADYQYMKEAISLRSFDYILQPVRKEELKNVMERARAQITVRKKNRELLSIGSFFSKRERDLLIEKSWQYLSGEISDDSYLKRLISDETGSPDVQDITLLNTPENLNYVPFLLETIKTIGQEPGMEEEIQRSMRQNLIDEILQFPGSCNILLQSAKEEDCLVIACLKDHNPQLNEKLESALENLRCIFPRVLMKEITIYYAGICEYGNLQKKTMRLIAEKQNEVSKISRIAFVREKGEEEFSEESVDSRILSWKTLISHNHFDELKDSAFEFLDEMCRDNRAERAYVQKIHQHLSELILAWMINHEIQSADVFYEPLTFYNFLYGWNTIEDLKKMLSELTVRLYSIENVPDDDVVRKMVRYIRQNMEKELTVSEVADIAGMNPEHLSRIFKKKTGMNLKRFIDQEKMEAARTLLETTNLPVTIISGHVGYSSYNTFTRSFRQMTGLSPSEYRKLKQEDAKVRKEAP